ncbi:RNA-directed DNA polymerase, eukaryota, reverse transcriptase zinc-binding domain protein [Tanacetum coccineum]
MKELFNICGKFGSVFDVFIAHKLSKHGKRFAFICYLKVNDAQHIIEGLRNTWIGSYKLYVNIGRFDRKELPNVSDPVKPHYRSMGRNSMQHNAYISYANIVQGKHVKVRNDQLNNDSMIMLKEDCLRSLDVSLTVFAYSVRLCIKTFVESLINESLKLNVRGHVVTIRAKEITGWILKFLEGPSNLETEQKEGMEIPANSDSNMEENHWDENDEEGIPSKDNDANEAFDSIEESHNGKDDQDTKENIEELVSDKESVKETHSNSHSFRDESLARTKSILEGFSMLDKFNDVIEFGQAMGFDMKGWIGRKVKKKWVRNLCTTHKLNFLSIQETKKEKFSSIEVRALWGNSYFDFSMALANRKSEGNWISTSTPIMLISVYAPQDFNEKKLLWNRLSSLMTGWNGETIIMGHFNKVRLEHERYWSIFHRNQAHAFNEFVSQANLIDISLGVKGILIDGEWVEEPEHVKEEFYNHFSTRFASPDWMRPQNLEDFPRSLSVEQAEDLEITISHDEVKRAVWDCGSNKAPGPNGFTFEFFKKFWNLVGTDVVKATDHFFYYGHIPIANRLSLVIDDLVSKEQSAFIKGRQILDGPFILNEMISWCKSHKQQALMLKIDFQKAYDSVRWDFLDDILARNNNRVTISHLFYADDAILIGKWSTSNVVSINRLLQYFYSAFGIKVNLCKSSLMGVSVPFGDVETMASVVRCKTSKLPVTYLRVKVGENMTRSKDWSDVISKVSIRLSKWKVEILSAEGRLTLLKSVLGSIPTYYMSLYKALRVVINSLESLRNKFFIGAKFDEKKLTWVAWKKVLSCKESRELGVNSLLALNHALLFKWIWRFRNDSDALWVRVVKSIHGADGLLSSSVNHPRHHSVWTQIIKATHDLKEKGDHPLKMRFPRVFSLDLNRNISVAQKKEQRSSMISFLRAPRSGIEATQWEEIKKIIDSVCLTLMEDRWIWSVNRSGLFSVASTRIMIDKLLLSSGGDSTKWCKLLLIKVDIMVWKLSLDRLPARLNLSSRDINIPTLHCSICEDHLESRDHLFFSCTFVNNVIGRFTRWWEIQIPHISTFQQWMDWGKQLNCLKTCGIDWGEVNSVYTDYIVFPTSEEMIQAEVHVED